ncbi:MAG: xanthine dehydrogenase family protein subunit M [Betaproteobacteria bacterium]|nr:xanthine dehydrogenase family protein subunit M [Betaproteobacteria bacterium]
MKAPAFAYVKPGSLGEVFDLIERHGEGAKLLAGGQSLIPSLNMRLSSPDLLIDITGISALAGIRMDRDIVRIGALATHAEIGQSPEIAMHVPLLAQAVPHIAHPAIRNRGTLGGSLAFADPAAEYPACALALDATLVIAGKGGERRVRADKFFKGLYETDLKRGEVLVAAEFPAAGPNERSAFVELARRQGDYAIIGLAARARNSDLRLAFLGAGATPILAKISATAAKESVAAAQAALAKDLDPPADLYHSSATKLHLARVLLGRALAELWNTKSKPH